MPFQVGLYLLRHCVSISYPFEQGQGSLLIREAVGPEETLPVQDRAVADVSGPVGVLESVPGLVEAIISTTHTRNLQPRAEKGIRVTSLIHIGDHLSHHQSDAVASQ